MATNYTTKSKIWFMYLENNSFKFRLLDKLTDEGYNMHQFFLRHLWDEFWS